MRAGKGNLFAGSHCKLLWGGGSAVHRRLGGKQEKEFFFLYDQYGNVIENKGPLWKTCAGAGMLLITKEINEESGNLIENKGDN